MKTYSIFISILLTSFSVFSQTYVTQVKVSGTKKWGYANLKGELIVPAQYEKCYKFSSEGLAAIYDASKREYFFINLKGEKLATEIFGFKLIDGFGFDVEGFTNGLAPVKQGDLWGYLNSSGQLAIPAKYNEAIEFNDGYGIVKSGIEYSILNTKGEEFPIDAKGIVDVKHFSEGMAHFRTGDKKFGFVDFNGKIVIPSQFQSAGYFYGGIAWAKADDGKVGFINLKGEWIIKPQFDAGKDFDSESGLARIKKDGEWAYVNKNGELMYMKDTDLWGDFSNGLASGRRNSLAGFFDNKGEWIIAPQFEAVRDFKNGYAAAKKEDRWGIIDKFGNWIMQPTYDGIKDIELIE